MAPSDSSWFFSKQLARFGDVFQNVLKNIQIGVSENIVQPQNGYLDVRKM